jgi:hemin uptake protein HemP
MSEENGSPSARASSAIQVTPDDGTERPQRVVASSELLAGGREVHIDHNGDVYTLRLTSKGKLILTK